MHHPTTTHFEAAKHVLHYVKGTLNHGIHFSPGPLTLSTFANADWAGDPTNRCSTTGFIVFLGSNPVSWSSKKQSTISRSSIEAEYITLATTTTELAWLRILFKELRLFLYHVLVLWCDNVSAIALSTNPVFHLHTKRIEVDYHYVREKFLRKDMCFRFVSGKDNLSNVFIKPLTAPLFQAQQRKLMVISSPFHLRGDVEDDKAKHSVSLSLKTKGSQTHRFIKANS